VTKNGNLLSGVVAALMMVALVACSENSSPPQAPQTPQDLVAKNDHAGLETWYKKETSDLRQRAKDMEMMVESYRKIQGKGTIGDTAAKILLIQHCQTLATTYAKAADEAEVIAQAHRDMKDHS
jgi:hypothetical protein